MSIFILNECARRFEGEAESPWLSLKCMLTGSARYEVNRRQFLVGHGQCLLLNEGTPYKIAINSPGTVESFVVFFQPEWASAALRVHIEKDQALLDEPFSRPEKAFSFQETLYELDGHLASTHRKLFRRHKSIGRDYPPQEELADELLAACVRRQSGLARESHNLVSQRKSTRIELQRRLQTARDFLLSNFSSKVSLEQVARASSMSRFHLSRRFKELYGTAPMAYLQEIRMRRATHLLRTTSKPVLEVCLEVGFESPTTFSTMIRQRTGLSPRALRKVSK